jgi:23S rRNA (cytosine1962-C5)-methyltransferase
LEADPALPIGAVFLKSATTYPLIYRKRLAGADAGARAGDLVAVYAPGDELLGYGLYNPKSEIVVRMVRHGPELPGEAYWQAMLEQAVRLRRELLRLDESTNAYRLIHAEGDGFSGLAVDRLGEVLSAEVFSLGMWQRAAALVERLKTLCGAKHSVIRPAPQFASQEGFLAAPILSDELPRETVVHEHGTRFKVAFEGGHKTGFFCDQRDNRAKLASFCKNRSVLDLCCYTGGFAVQAKRLGGAAEVVAVDLDEVPLRLARQNGDLNQVRVKFVQADAFGYMRDAIQNGRLFDVVVLDPPKLIRNRDELADGTRKHFDLNRLALQLVRPGGLMLSCSCSGLLPEDDFLRLLFAAARAAHASERPAPARGARASTAPVAGRTLQIIGKSGAAADHPVAPQCPETEYLKAVWLAVH